MQQNEKGHEDCAQPEQFGVAAENLPVHIQRDAILHAQELLKHEQHKIAAPPLPNEKIEGDDAENRPHHDRRQAEKQLSFQLRIVVIPWMDAFQFCTPLPIWS